MNSSKVCDLAEGTGLSREQKKRSKKVASEYSFQAKQKVKGWQVEQKKRKEALVSEGFEPRVCDNMKDKEDIDAPSWFIEADELLQSLGVQTKYQYLFWDWHTSLLDGRDYCIEYLKISVQKCKKKKTAPVLQFSLNSLTARNIHHIRVVYKEDGINENEILLEFQKDMDESEEISFCYLVMWLKDSLSLHLQQFRSPQEIRSPAELKLYFVPNHIRSGRYILVGEPESKASHKKEHLQTFISKRNPAKSATFTGPEWIFRTTRKPPGFTRVSRKMH